MSYRLNVKPLNSLKAYLKKDDEPKKIMLEQIEKNKTLEVGKIEKQAKRYRNLKVTKKT